MRPQKFNAVGMGLGCFGRLPFLENRLKRMAGASHRAFLSPTRTTVGLQTVSSLDEGIRNSDKRRNRSLTAGPIPVV